MDSLPWLTAIVALPVIAACAVPVIPDKEGKTLRWYALGIGLLDLALMLFAFVKNYDLSNPGFQMVESYAWVPQIGLNWSLAVDGLAMPLFVLTGVVNVLAIAAAWNTTRKPRLFYALMLVLLSAQLGVFAAQDMLLFFFMWEIELVPVYLLISIWGGPKRLYAATKFILYTAFASIFILIGALAMAFYGDNFTFDMAQLGMKNYPVAFQIAVYLGLLVAFGVKLPMFPLHTWLPDAHGEASAPVSMVLAGVLLKMGGYALIRLNMELLPDAHIYFAPALAILGVVNIVYGAFAAFAQDNLKRRLACSSISHMGFILIGIASFSEVGINGAMLQMISHGLIAAMLFFLAGVTYERTHTLSMEKMQGLAGEMPKTFALFTAGAMASLALPGMSGFVGELTVFIGIANSDIYSNTFKLGVVVCAAIGLIATPIYLLSMLRRMFFGQAGKLELDVPTSGWLDVNPREIAITACLLVPIIGIGFYPKVATQTYDTKTTEVASTVRESLPIFAQRRQANPFLSSGLFAPDLLAEVAAPDAPEDA
ncbi:MAG: NAD(P)H-quinone oxidoreductase subunit 4 [Geitlerinemataceae cyanobacterium]